MEMENKNNEDSPGKKIMKILFKKNADLYRKNKIMWLPIIQTLWAWSP